MSIVMNIALGVEMTLFKRSFTVNRSAVGVPQSKTMSKLLSPYVSLVLFTSAFCGRTSQTILEYVMSSHLSSGTSDLLMKNIVLVPLFLPGIPCANLPISFPKEMLQSFLYFGLLIRW